MDGSDRENRGVDEWVDSVSAEVARYLVAYPETEYIDGFTFDLCGAPMGKRCLVSEAGKIYSDGLALCAAALLLDAGGNTCDPMGFGVSDGDPDAVAWPVFGTLGPIPWSNGQGAQVLLEMRYPNTDRALPYDPRQILRSVVARFESLAMIPVVAIELEFYLVDLARGDHGEPLPVKSPVHARRATRTQVYSIEALEEYSGVLNAITEACRQQGVPAYIASGEFAPGQFEINVRHVSDAVLAADHACLLKRTVRAVARQFGMDATFLSKPFADHSGSGLHVHMSFLNNDGVNIFDKRIDADERLIRQAIAGLQTGMAESMAIFAPNFNAFRRFIPGQFVPVTKDWGYDNRSVAFRIPSGRGQSRRIEHRVAGADANPYLVLASVLASVHHGLTHELAPMSAPFVGNASVTVDPALPLTLWDALGALSQADLLDDYFGASNVTIYKTVKQNEMHALLSVPSPREYDWYL